MKVYLIIGAGSDIGITYIERLVKNDDIRIIALYRNMSENLKTDFAVIKNPTAEKLCVATNVTISILSI